jgi:hypothetical protein
VSTNGAFGPVHQTCLTVDGVTDLVFRERQGALRGCSPNVADQVLVWSWEASLGLQWTFVAASSPLYGKASIEPILANCDSLSIPYGRLVSKRK